MINAIVKSIAENMKSLINLKANIKQAIESKNVPVNDSIPFEQYADKIAEIEEGDIFSENYKLYKFLLNNTYTNAYGLFANKSLTSIDLSDWDAKNITNMKYMFGSCANLTTIKGLTSLNTSNVTNMKSMFESCTGLTSLDLTGLNTSNVTDMCYMFYGCSNLTSLDLTNLNTSNVTNMSIMFAYCGSDSGSFSIDLSSWDISSLTSMQMMFIGCNAVGINLSTWDTSNITGTGEMFHLFWGCEQLQVLDISNFVIANKNVLIRSGYTNQSIFYDCLRLHKLRLDNCSKETISILLNQYQFPTNTILYKNENGEDEEVPRIIYCKESAANGLTPPENWIFEYVD